ncbi:hypothetical protein SUGI_0172530 [Cryptomeria japonica]|uniref:uridylate kinase PUMPKIN, chloroplastic isoform X1 n=2 Tax=Cryptomeria japonica TaxID=3369 RepID=UPI002408B5C6|nr:uridylate kinase PUMPKIN, chloroplastic isoform X1 [Cryptomeria japonica]GLJ11608.1 hypothetical protein SUGI_0172530 [Cryptomeria japonica]
MLNTQCCVVTETTKSAVKVRREERNINTFQMAKLASSTTSLGCCKFPAVPVHSSSKLSILQVGIAPARILNRKGPPKLTRTCAAAPILDMSSTLQIPRPSPFKMITNDSPRWRRVLLKVSGEALAGDGEQNVDPKIAMTIAREVASVAHLGVEVAIVVGGGNFFRGSTWAGCSGLDRSSADHIGMLATVMNAIFLQATMESIGIPTRVQTAFRMSEVAEPYIRRRAIRHLEKGRVVIFAAGTGNPFFTTDTAAALRCAEINAEVVLKATNVDGVYDNDPRVNPDASLLDFVTYRDVTSKDLLVMDLTAITLCQENNIPIVVFNLNKPGNISRALCGEHVGTLIAEKLLSEQT